MHVLVTYASKHGSTAQVAKRIALALVGSGVKADVLPVRDVGDIGRYEAVVLGSSVYFGKWAAEAVGFADHNRTTLAKRPVWLFSVGPLGEQPRSDPAEVARIMMSIKAVDHHLFAGALNVSGLSFLERVIVKGVKAPTGDFRDWNEIDSWATTIARQLSSSGAEIASNTAKR
jgi:menaquinone-dependent protoporphyrinogen oxidase